VANLRRWFQGVVAALLLAGWAAPATAAPAARDRLGDFALMAENETFALYADAASLAFQVEDKRSGYIWNSNLTEVTEEDDLNRTWTAFATSGISIDALDAKAVDERASITRDEHTVDFRPTSTGFEAIVTFTELSISLGVRVQLEATGVHVEVPFQSIAETGEYKLGRIYLYPFLGATREADVRGYMFIPDGAGSLVRFAETTKARNMFYGRYYGDDLGMLGEVEYDPTIIRPHTLSLPVSGMVHGEGENAYLTVIERGAPYGELQLHPAGVTTRFNFLYTAFIYNQSYFQATNKAGAGVTTIQPSTNNFDIGIHYRFLTGAESDYVGLARSYQQYLIERGQLPNAVTPASDIGIRLEFLGAEKEPILLWQRLIPMTTVSQMADVLAALDVRHPEVIYYGWQPNGASAMPPRSLRLERRLGSLSQLRDLAQTVAAEGGYLSLYFDPQGAIIDEGGYSARNDLARAITSENLFGGNRGKPYFYLKFPAVSERYGDLADTAFAEPNLGLAVDGLSNILYSDFRRDSLLGRDDAAESYQALLAAHPGRTGFYLPNDYVFSQMRAYYDIPVTDSGYIYTSETVPFLEIVLAGYVPTYGPPLNFSADTQTDLLRHVDFNVYPSYFLSHEPTSKIIYTRSGWIYSSAINQWEAEIERAYAWLNNLLGPVQGQPIVARAILAEDVFATTYANGRQIIVNYGLRPFQDGATVVNGRDAILREVQP
jgi:hypothetical protein